MEDYQDLGQRLDDIYPEIECEILTKLPKHCEEYAAMRHELTGLKERHPNVAGLLGCDEKARLTDGDYAILIKAMRLRNRLEDIERQQIYFRGHTDAIAYLKKVGAI